MLVAQHQVQSATLIDSQRHIEVTTTQGDKYQATFVSGSGDGLQKQLLENHIGFKVVDDERSWFERNIVGWLPFVFIWLIYFVVVGAPKLFSSGFLGGTDYQAERPRERFSDVKGAQEAIGELGLVVDSLLHPEKYEGLPLDRGYLFYGPTGTGKTLLAKAVAGEAGVPFYRLAGAGLVSMWAGGTSQRIESFFRRVRKDLKTCTSPAVIFIDELDGLAGRRIGSQGADRDRNTAVTQLLNQIGELFDYYHNVVVIGATNRLDELDEAVKRPGRLGKHIAMPNPDLEARTQILLQSAQKIGLPDVDIVLLLN